ncbi:MAG: response regulator transcription factor [Clostridiaceae bacterium]|nr:response regulator transcription factor [Clostridiaceae bacterium]
MNEEINILVVEDDVDINELLARILRKNGYTVKSAYSGSEGKTYADMFKYDLILLDLMLPGESGENIIEEIRKNKYMPIIVISAKSSKEDKVNALSLGADDFITKPFEIEEVLARVAAQLRRYTKFSENKEEQEEVSYKNIVLNKDSRQVFVKGKEVQLTLREFDILKLLITNKNKVFTRENLFESVWGNEFLEDYNTVNVHVSNLRSKLSKADPKEEYIQTVWGIGFKFKE